MEKLKYKKMICVLLDLLNISFWVLLGVGVCSIYLRKLAELPYNYNLAVAVFMAYCGGLTYLYFFMKSYKDFLKEKWNVIEK